MKRNFVMFTKKACPYCKRAVDKMEKEEHDYEIVQLDKNPNSLKMIKNLYGWETVPIILEYHSDERQTFVGGYTDLLEYFEEKND